MPKKYGEVRRILRRAGWRPVRQKGSHQRWIGPQGGTVTVSGKDSQDVRAGTLSSMRRSTGLEELR